MTAPACWWPATPPCPRPQPRPSPRSPPPRTPTAHRGSLCATTDPRSPRGCRPNTGPSAFSRTLTDWGTRPIHSSPYHPQTCGKVERHHQTLKRWLAHQPDQPTTLAQLQTLLDTYREYYNTRRRHSALGRRTPHDTWNSADQLGSPDHLTIQDDANVHYLKVSATGTINLGRGNRIRIGTTYATHTITVIHDHDRATVYTSNGDPIGYIHLDHTKTYQGKLTPAASHVTQQPRQPRDRPTETQHF